MQRIKQAYIVFEMYCTGHGGLIIHTIQLFYRVKFDKTKIKFSLIWQISILINVVYEF